MIKSHISGNNVQMMEKRRNDSVVSIKLELILFSLHYTFSNIRDKIANAIAVMTTTIRTKLYNSTTESIYFFSSSKIIIMQYSRNWA